jgi:hypothetical protein
MPRAAVYRAGTSDDAVDEHTSVAVQLLDVNDHQPQVATRAKVGDGADFTEDIQASSGGARGVRTRKSFKIIQRKSGP